VGNYQKSIEEAKKALALDPDFTFGYVNLAYTWFYLDRLKEAKEVAAQASARKLEIPDILLLRYYAAFLERNEAEMKRVAAQAEGVTGAEDWISDAEALVAAWSGRMAQASTMSRRAVELALKAGLREKAATYEAGAAVWNALFGNIADAKRGAARALGMSNGHDVEYAAAFALANAGEVARAGKLADDLEQRFPEDTSVRFNYVPSIRAACELRQGQPSKAIDILQVALPNERAISEIEYDAYFGGFEPVYVRGEAYLKLKRAADAAVEFRRLSIIRGLHSPIRWVRWRGSNWGAHWRWPAMSRGQSARMRIFSRSGGMRTRTRGF
jgi:hypothetical protein